MGRLALGPVVFVTVTLAAPAEPAGVVAVIWLGLTTVTAVAAALPKLIVAPARKFVPLMVTAVPPPVGPLVGEMLVSVGGGAGGAGGGGGGGGPPGPAGGGGGGGGGP